MNRLDAIEYTEALGQVVSGGWRQIALAERLGVPKALGLTTREWVQQHLGGYIKLNIADRQQAVAELVAEGKSQREIGAVLGVDSTTVHHDVHAAEKSAESKEKPSENGAPPAENSASIHFSSESPEHYTPRDVLAAVVECFGAIDLDPCSNDGAPNVPAARHYTRADDGLAQPWYGRVFMNPPYGREIGLWVRKLLNEQDVTAAIALVPARTDTEWFDNLTREAVVCFVTGRLTFIGNEEPAPFPSAIVYLGPHQDHFARVFQEFGSLWCRPSRPLEFFVEQESV